LNDENNNESENISLSAPAVDASMSIEPKPFAIDQMIRCEECLRANGPTKVNCLYCGAALPFNETLVNLQKPALRPLEKWEQGYNNILLPSSANRLPHDPRLGNPGLSNLTEADLAEAADLLKLTPPELARILSFALPLPVARASTMDEALLVQRRLTRLRIETAIVADGDLGVVEAPPIRVRAMTFEPAGFKAYQAPETPGHEIKWSSLMLAVTGRLVVKRVELREQKTTRAEDKIVDANEFYKDEPLVELYTERQTTPYRIAAHSFDFSCLGPEKSLVAGENLDAMIDLLRKRAPQLECDDSYNTVRKALESVWPSERQHEAGGWRRARPGKYSIESATEVSNDLQFLRYSRLRHYFRFVQRKKDEDA